MRISPFLGINSLIGTRTVTAWFICVLPVLLISFFIRRWFCLYLCPVGLLLEMISKLRKVNTAAIFGSVPPLGRGIVYLALGSALFGYPLFLWLDPLVS